MSGTTENTRELLRKSRVVVDTETYTAVSIAHGDWDEVIKDPELSPAMNAPFVLFKDAWEVTMIVPERQAIGLMQSRFQIQKETGFRLVSFDVDLDFDVVGFMALITGIAAEAGVSILSFASFKRDHLFVRQEQLSEFLIALRGHVGEVC